MSLLSILNSFRSKKLTIILITSVVILLFLTVLIPQRGFSSTQEVAQFKRANLFFYVLDALGFTNIVYSFWLFVLVAFLFLNTLACLTDQFKKALNRSKREFTFPVAIERMPDYKGFQGEIFPEEKIITLLQKKRYRLTVEKKGKEMAIIARKGSFHFLGTLFFHFALLLLFIGLGLTTLLRFSGGIELTEGEIAREGERAFYGYNRPLVFTGFPPFSLKLVHFSPTFYPNGDFRSVKSTIRLGTYQEVVEKEVKASSPLTYLGYRVNQLAIGGVSPRLLLTDKNGVILESVYIPFERKDLSMSPLEGYYQFKKKKVSVKGFLYPQARVKNGKLILVSYKINQPVLDLFIKESGGTKRIQLKMGQSVGFKDFSLYFDEARYWTRFQIVYDPGTWFSFTGFGLALLGLIAIYFLTEKAILIKIEKTRRTKVKVQLAGRKSNRMAGNRDLVVVQQALENWLEVRG